MEVLKYTQIIKIEMIQLGLLTFYLADICYLLYIIEQIFYFDLIVRVFLNDWRSVIY